MRATAMRLTSKSFGPKVVSHPPIAIARKLPTEFRNEEVYLTNCQTFADEFARSSCEEP
jgi:hypothetical protein